VLTLANSMSHTCFFYGTLLHPAVIKKVIENDAEHLAFSPAVLFVRDVVSTSSRLSQPSRRNTQDTMSRCAFQNDDPISMSNS
jgi:hypothetical protein